MSRLEALAAGKACCARLYSYSRLKRGNHSPGLPPGGFLISASTVPHRGERGDLREMLMLKMII